MTHREIPLEPLAPAASQAYVSASTQVADILRWILDQTGPASIIMSSFSISEEFLRRLFFIKEEGLVKSISIVLDFKATNKTLKLWPFIARTVESCHLADNHSKVLLVFNDSWKVAVSMSQNLTRGNRYEAGIVSTDPAVFDTLLSSLNFIISRKSVPFHEIFARTVDNN